MGKFGRGESRETPPNNKIPKADLFDFFEVFLDFIWGINWNLLSFFGVGHITEGKKQEIAATTSLGKKWEDFRKTKDNKCMD